ncbi:hypothetical protein [Bacillus sp. FJAT-28004]|uniref:hypothetical protein n=1 Tax=Bacillus sp. FJAT-28004 TaxID=1679165 RepID=UPI0006B5DD69|nr:hypothetical protein [Bacillus sp. FJAT-28004]
MRQMNIPTGMNAIYSNSEIIQVELKKCRDWLSFSYTDDGWHYQSALIRQYINDPTLQYSKSILKQYYDRFQPHCLQEILFENRTTDLPPIHKAGPPMPWLASPPRFGKIYQHYGPNTDSFIKNEFSRTIDIFEQLNQSSYQPEKYQNGYIRGYFLKNGSDYRFIVTNGHHRMAALAILKYETIKVMIDPKISRVCDIQEVNAWINVRNGIYPQKLALDIFNIPFTKNGKEKALSLGLYSKIY